MQNSRNVEVGSLENQPKTHTGKDQFFVTVSSGIRDRDTRVAEIVVRELQKANLGSGDTWGYVQAADLWSPKEETHVCPGHNWMLKFGKVAGSMS